MKISNDAKKDILFNSFNILKSNYEVNQRDVNEIIGKMASIDLAVSLDMWEYILKSNSEHITDNAGYINDNKAYGITSSIIYEIIQKIGLVSFSEAIGSRPSILDAIFGKSANIDDNQCEIISEYINRGNLSITNEIFRKLLENKHNKGQGFSLTVGQIFQNVIKNLDPEISNDSVELLNHWIQQIKNPQEKAKATVRLLDLI